jgi:ribonucleoside-diphosphate reductase alpha chain
MNVIKRNGAIQEVSFDKIIKRIKYLISEPYDLPNVNAYTVTLQVFNGLYNNVSTMEIDVYSATVCNNLSIQNYEYGILAGRIAINNHQKNTLTGFKDKVDKLYLRKDSLGNPCPIVSTQFYKFVKKNQKVIEKHIDYNRDYLLDFFGFSTLEKAYLIKIDDVIIERPQDLFMRVAIFIHMDKKNPKIMEMIFETYDLLSNKYFTHATPTLFNAGLVRPSLASCFLLGVEDSIDGIFKALTDCAKISKLSGGVGLAFSDVRGSKSLIRGTGGTSSGIVPFLKIFESTSLAVNQGGRRPGSFSPYLEPHHPDIIEFLAISKKNSDEESKANKLYLALWISDLFMKRVVEDGDWYTFCPNKCPGLSDCYGDEYENLYLQYTREKRFSKKYRAREIWFKIFESQKESGVPYILYKDAVNRNNNQSNIGIIKCSNLCSEIVEYSSPTEYAVCVLSSICLPKFVEDSYNDTELELSEEDRRVLDHEFPINPIFNYTKFKHVINVIVRNLNKVIDCNYYPVVETKRSNIRHRPLGIGVQGLADVFFKFNISYDSPDAVKLNKYIFETLYYTALSASSKLARETFREYSAECRENGKVYINTNPVVLDNGKVTWTRTEYTSETDIPTTCGAYPSYLDNGGSPLSNGIFHWEMMGLREDEMETNYDWDSLRAHIKRYGVCNSMLCALMPTASTSQIMGNIETFEILTSNIFIRSTIAGEFIIVNKYLMNDLQKLGLWNKRVENLIKLNGGSIQAIDDIPKDIRRKYRTSWEISQKHIIDLASDRQYFIDQSQSLNLFIEDLTYASFSSMHTYSWKKGLKTGCYYLRSREACTAQKFTADDENVVYNSVKITGPDEECLVCSA